VCVCVCVSCTRRVLFVFAIWSPFNQSCACWPVGLCLPARLSGRKRQVCSTRGAPSGLGRGRLLRARHFIPTDWRCGGPTKLLVRGQKAFLPLSHTRTWSASTFRPCRFVCFAGTRAVACARACLGGGGRDGDGGSGIDMHECMHACIRGRPPSPALSCRPWARLHAGDCTRTTGLSMWRLKQNLSRKRKRERERGW
jgi:hypothetical protein